LPVFVVEGAALAGLSVRRDERQPDRHAFVEPFETVSLDQLQAALCSTRGRWQEV
jgi:hypothetical protein